MDNMLDILEKYLVSRLKFIRQIAEFMPGFCSEEEEEIVDVLKQLADYDISAKTVWKSERKYYKVVMTLFTYISWWPTYQW